MIANKKKQQAIRVKIAEIRHTPGVVMRAFDKRTKITELILADLKDNGTFFKTQQGLFYFQKGERPRLLPLDNSTMALSALISEGYGINPAEQREYRHILAGIQNEAFLRGAPVQVHQLAHYNAQANALYVSRFDGWMYRLNGGSIERVPNGADNMFFWDNPQWEPYEPELQDTGLLEQVIAGSANFSEAGGLSASDQQLLLKMWLLSVFFDTLHPTKPLLLICGEKGGGKTLTLRKCLRLLFGAGGEVSALEHSKADGFVATVCSQPIAVFDNVDESIGWLPDHLAQVATGVSFRRRKLYTTNEELAYTPLCFIALTSRTPKFIEGRDDVLDRMLVLQTERRSEFVPEQSLLREVEMNRNNLMGELLMQLNRVVAYIGEHGTDVGPVRSRMADFASFALLVARVEGRESDARRILGCLDASRTDILLEQEPIYPCLEIWLRDERNHGREVSSGDLQRELAEIAEREHFAWPYKNDGRSLGQRLSHITSNLSQRFRIESERDAANQWHYRFWPKAESLNQPESSFGAIQPAKSLEMSSLAA